MANHRRSGEKERHWREVIREQVRSGLSIRAFCREQGLSEPSFYSWRRELRRRDTAPRSRRGEGDDHRPQLVPVSVAASPECVEVVLSGGVVLRVPEGTAIQTLRDVLAALEPERC